MAQKISNVNKVVVAVIAIVCAFFAYKIADKNFENSQRSIQENNLEVNKDLMNDPDYLRDVIFKCKSYISKYETEIKTLENKYKVLLENNIDKEISEIKSDMSKKNEEIALSQKQLEGAELLLDQLKINELKRKLEILETNKVRLYKKLSYFVELGEKKYQIKSQIVGIEHKIEEVQNKLAEFKSKLSTLESEQE